MVVRTQFAERDLTGDLSELHALIAKAIPLSAGRYNAAIDPAAQVRR